MTSNITFNSSLLFGAEASSIALLNGVQLVILVSVECFLTSHRSPVARQSVASIESSSLIFHGTLYYVVCLFYRDEPLTTKDLTMRTEQLTKFFGPLRKLKARLSTR